MLTEHEKLEMYFEEARSRLDPIKVVKNLQARVDALILGIKVQLFSSEWCKDPRQDDEWKQRVRSNVIQLSQAPEEGEDFLNIGDGRSPLRQ